MCSKALSSSQLPGLGEGMKFAMKFALWFPNSRMVDVLRSVATKQFSDGTSQLL